MSADYRALLVRARAQILGLGPRTWNTHDTPLLSEMQDLVGEIDSALAEPDALAHAREENAKLRTHIADLIRTGEANSGAEPSLSVWGRAVGRAMKAAALASEATPEPPLPGAGDQCDRCDPSFGCFGDSAEPCQKPEPQPPPEPPESLICEITARTCDLRFGELRRPANTEAWARLCVKQGRPADWAVGWIRAGHPEPMAGLDPLAEPQPKDEERNT